MSKREDDVRLSILIDRAATRLMASVAEQKVEGERPCTSGLVET